MSREREEDPRELLLAAIKPRFQLGRVVATPRALAGVPMDEMRHALGRHWSGDWGDLDDDDRAANEQALLDGSRLLSAYKTRDAISYWIITEADRSVTTVLLPSEY